MSSLRRIARTAGLGLVATAIVLTAAGATMSSGSLAKVRSGKSRKAEYAMVVPHVGIRLACRIDQLKRRAALRITNRDAFWIEAGHTIIWRTGSGAAGIYKLPYALHAGKSIRLPVASGGGTCAARLR